MKFIITNPYQKLSREGLIEYLGQSPGSSKGRTDWDLGILATLFLNVEHAAIQEGSRLAWTRDGLETLIRDTEQAENRLYDSKGYVVDQKEFFRLTQMLRLLNELSVYLPKDKVQG